MKYNDYLILQKNKVIRAVYNEGSLILITTMAIQFFVWVFFGGGGDNMEGFFLQLN